MKKKEGEYIIDHLEFLKEIVKSSPQRLLRTKFASILVKQKIPTRGEDINGPHTHLLLTSFAITSNFQYPLTIIYVP